MSKNIWHFHTMEYHLAIKELKTIHRASWVNLKHIMLSQKSQAEKGTYYMSVYMKSVMGWIVCSPNLILKPWPPVPQNVTVFGDKVFKNVMKLKWGH